MQYFIQFYTIVVFACFLFFKPFNEIVTSRFLRFLFLLLCYAGIAMFWSNIRPGSIPSFVIITGWIARVLFIPVSYLYLRNHISDQSFTKRDSIHLLPAVIFCIGTAVGWLINGHFNFLFFSKEISLSLPSLAEEITVFCFQLFVYVVTAAYLWFILSLLKENYENSRSEKEIIKVGHNGFASNDHDKKNGEAHSIFLSEEKMASIDITVKEFLTEKKPFLKHGYSLKGLSDDINIPLHHLSAFINRYYKMNFNDFINEYRVNHCKVKIINDEWKSKKLEAIADESGFSNRNTFTSAFKKATGLNPSGFLKKIKEEQKHCEPLFIDMDLLLNNKKMEKITT